MWQDFFSALALVFVIEGLLPFLNPTGFKRTSRLLSDLDESTLRRFGLLAMGAGLVLLYLVR